MIFKVLVVLDMGIKDPPLITTMLVDRLVSYVLYHSDKVSPDSRDMNSKKVYIVKELSIFLGSDVKWTH